MEDHGLACALEATLTADDEVAIAFTLLNHGHKPVEIRHFVPFLDFELTAWIDDSEVPLVQPALEAGLHPVTVTVGPGETVRVATPIRLRYDPHVGPSGGELPTRWTLRHLPAPTLLRASVRIGGATVGPCEVLFDPRQQQR